MRKLYTFLTLILIGLFAQAQTNNALSFDGVDDFITTAYTGVPGSGARTIEAYIKTAVNADDSNGGIRQVICDIGPNQTGRRFTFAVRQGNALRAEFSGGGLTGVTPVNDGLWHHVAVVYDPTSTTAEISLYLDGVLDASGNIAIGINTDTSPPFTIGTRAVASTDTFNGEMDEIRVWSRALTASEISANMSTEVCADEADLELYYQFDEGIANMTNTSVISVPDLAGISNGTLSGFALTGTSSNWINAPAGLATLINTDVTESNGILTAQQAGATYLWIDCASGSNVAGANSATFAPTAIGNYAAIITFNGCSQLSACVNVSALSNSSVELNNLNLDENPSQFLSFTGDLDNDAQISIYTLSGQELLNTTMSSQTINPAVAAGLYIVNVSQNGASKTFKWIKK